MGCNWAFKSPSYFLPVPKVDEYLRDRDGVPPVGAAQVERPNLGTGSQAQVTK